MPAALLEYRWQFPHVAQSPDVRRSVGTQSSFKVDGNCSRCSRPRSRIPDSFLEIPPPQRCRDLPSSWKAQVSTEVAFARNEITWRRDHKDHGSHPPSPSMQNRSICATSRNSFRFLPRWVRLFSAQTGVVHRVRFDPKCKSGSNSRKAGGKMATTGSLISKMMRAKRGKSRADWRQGRLLPRPVKTRACIHQDLPRAIRVSAPDMSNLRSRSHFQPPHQFHPNCCGHGDPRMRDRRQPRVHKGG